MSHPASSYPTERRNWTVDGRRKIFALTFQRLLINSQAIKDLGFEGIHLLTRIVLIEDELRHSQPVKMWNTEVEHLLGLKVDAMRRVRQACIDHGWLHYVPGRKRKIGQYWVTIPDEAVRDEWLNDDAGEEIPPPVSGVKPTESQHKADGKPTQSRTPSIPVPDPENSSSTVSDFESGGGGIFEDDANESAVSEMLATKPVESGSGSTAVSVDSSRDASAESDASTMVPPVCGTDEVAIAATIERVKSEHFTNSLAADRFGNRKFGLADQAVRTAIARGHTTASVDAICDFVESRPGFYGAGAVYVRLTTEAYVTDEPQDSWATPDPVAFAKWKHRREQEARRKQDAAATVLYQQRKEKETAPLVQLEIHWPAIEKMSTDEILVMLAGESQTRRYFTRSNYDRNAPMIRTRLLKLYAAQQEVVHAKSRSPEEQTQEAVT